MPTNSYSVISSITVSSTGKSTIYHTRLIVCDTEKLKSALIHARSNTFFQNFSFYAIIPLKGGIAMKERNASIDLLKIISMLMVVVLHATQYGIAMQT